MNLSQNHLDAILVLGAGGAPWGNYVRAKQAAEYHHHNPDIPIILTGGRGLLCKGMEKTEAETLAEELSKLGIEKRVVKLETEAKNTKENFEKSRIMLYLLDVKRVGIVTHSSHMHRALQYARQIMPEYKAVPIPVKSGILDLKSRISEFLCLGYEIIKNALEPNSKVYK